MNRAPLYTAVFACVTFAHVDRAFAQPAPYTATKGRVESAMQPQIRLDIDTALSYVGSQRWILYNVAQAEQHLYVQRSPSGVQRFLWIQFEEYIPSSNGKYDYSRSAPISAFGRELRTDKRFWTVPTTETRPESDGAYARRMLREKGMTLPPHMLYERFIYLPDSTGRRELMVIYAEELGFAGAIPADTLPAAKARLDALLAEHERRGLRTFTIAPR
jgi:hypothetical protein